VNLTFANVDAPVAPRLLVARILVRPAVRVVADCSVNAVDVTSRAGFTTLTIAGSYVNVISAAPIFPPTGAVTMIGSANVPPAVTLKFAMLMLCAAAGKTSTSSSAEKVSIAVIIWFILLFIYILSLLYFIQKI
jgi:hypothetical protein